MMSKNEEVKTAIERNQRGYEYADEQGWIYHNKHGLALRFLDPVDLDILVGSGFIQRRDDGTYGCTDKRYSGVILSDILDTLRIYNAVLRMAYYVETED